MRVFRWESERQDGPYRLSVPFDWMFDHNNMETHPTPGCENLSYGDGTMQCGFVSMIQAKAWFAPNERLDMLAAGFMFVELDAGAVEIGKHQCVFYRPNAKLVRVLTKKEIMS